MKNKKLRLSALLLAVMLVVSLIALPASAEFNSEVRDATVVVGVGYSVVDTGESTLIGWGSGFFVGEDGENPTYLVTNYHVVEDFVTLGSGADWDYKINWNTTVKIRSKIWVYYDSSSREEAYLVDYNETNDVAILKLASATTKRVPVTLEVPTESMVGKSVYAVGFPSLADNVFSDATSTWGSTDCTVTSGVMSRLFVESGTGCEKVQIDCVIRPGNSGGPLVNDNGNVIGINTEYVSSSGAEENVYYAVNISEAITLLKRSNIAYADAGDIVEETTAATTEATTEPETTEAPTETVTEAATEAPTVEEIDDTDNTASEEGSGIPTWLILAIVAIIAVVIVIVVVVASKKPKKTEQAKQTAAPIYNTNTASAGSSGFQKPQNTVAQPVHTVTQTSASSTADPGTTILRPDDGGTTVLTPKAEGGKLVRKKTGETIEINRASFLLGRKREDVNYQLTGNNAISRKHVELIVRNGVTYVKPLSTSNATYLNGQELKLGEEKELHDGDKITFAEEDFIYSKK